MRIERRDPDLLVRPRYLLAASTFFLLMAGVGALPGKAHALSAIVPDKLLHFTAYSFISSLLFAGLAGSPLQRSMRTVLLAALLGAVDEGIQELMPYRDADLRDWKVDVLAAISSATFLSWMSRRRRAPAPSFDGSSRR